MPNAKFTIAVIGTINKDLIIPYQADVVESFGGIYFCASALSALSDFDTLIQPLSFVGNDVYEALLSELNHLENVDASGLIRLDQKNHRSFLTYTSLNEREETSAHPFPPLEWKDIEIAIAADIVIVNLICGWDLDLAAYENLCNLAGDRLFLDIHYLLMGRDEQGKRFLHKPKGVEKWLKGPKVLQMNEAEFKVLDGEIGREMSFHKKNLRPDQILIVTRGEKGSTVVCLENNQLTRSHYNGYQVDNVIDPTGCGDVFGAAFMLHYGKGGEVASAAIEANLAAAANTQLNGTNEMSRLKSQMKRLNKLK